MEYVCKQLWTRAHETPHSCHRHWLYNHIAAESGISMRVSSAVRFSEGNGSSASPTSSFCSFQVTSKISTLCIWSCILTYTCLTEKGDACLQRSMLRKWDHPLVWLERVANWESAPQEAGVCWYWEVLLSGNEEGRLWWWWSLPF